MLRVTTTETPYFSIAILFQIQLNKTPASNFPEKNSI